MQTCLYSGYASNFMSIISLQQNSLYRAESECFSGTSPGIDKKNRSMTVAVALISIFVPMLWTMSTTSLFVNLFSANFLFFLRNHVDNLGSAGRVM